MIAARFGPQPDLVHVTIRVEIMSLGLSHSSESRVDIIGFAHVMQIRRRRVRARRRRCIRVSGSGRIGCHGCGGRNYFLSADAIPFVGAILTLVSHGDRARPIIDSANVQHDLGAQVVTLAITASAGDSVHIQGQEGVHPTCQL